MRLGEPLGLEQLLELLWRQQLLREQEVQHLRAGGERFARDFRGARIAKDRGERGHQRSRFVEQAACTLAVRGDALDAAVGERAAAGGEVVEALLQAVC